MKLGVLLRAHARAEPLRVVLRELLRYRDDLGFDVKIHCWVDRPTHLVQRVLDSFRGEFYGLRYAPFPLLDDRQGERFMEQLELQLREIDRARPDWVLLQDDDRVFEPLGADKELPEALARDDVDLLYAQSWFLWDNTRTVNVARHHNSPVLFRWAPDLHFPPDRMLQAPLPLHDEAIVQGRTALLRTPLLDAGTLTKAERRRVYSAFLAAGKADRYVESIEAPPSLLSVDELIRRPWKDPFADLPPS